MKQRIVILFVALAMLICTVTAVYTITGRYDGLGLKKSVPENLYAWENFEQKKGRVSYSDETYRSVTGIDVSYYQQKIDWKKVADDDVDFAMIRMGYRGFEEGKLQKDSFFGKNIKDAKKAGLDVGVYFFSQAVSPAEAVEEARYVIRHIKGKGVNYPVVFDMEPIPGTERIKTLTKKEKTEIADAFCQVIERNGYTPMIYGNPDWLKNHIELSYLTRYPIWLAHYTADRKPTDFPFAFDMWQYTDKGKVKGIKGKVDLNIRFISDNNADN